MAKKKIVENQALILRAPMTAEQRLRLAEHEWDEAFTKANREYNEAVDWVWRRYVEALRAGSEQDYNGKYDQERAKAVDEFNYKMSVADERFDQQI